MLHAARVSLSLPPVSWAFLLRTSRLLDEWAVHLLHSTSLLLPWCRRIPVVHHLDSKDKVKDKSRNESIKDKRIINLLDGRENARQRSSEVVEDLMY